MSGRFITSEAIGRFEKYLAAEEKSAATIEKYVRDASAFSEYAGSSEITKERVIGYKLYLQKYYAVLSVNSMLASLNRLFDFLGWLDFKVKSLRLQQRTFCAEERELTKPEYVRLYKTADGRRNERLGLIYNKFVDTAFSNTEKILINTAKYSNYDKIIFLSTSEASKYSELCGKCYPTAYARANGVDVDSDGSCIWWLRSSMNGWSHANHGVVQTNGYVTYEYSNDVEKAVVRPAMWIDLGMMI